MLNIKVRVALLVIGLIIAMFMAANDDGRDADEPRSDRTSDRISRPQPNSSRRTAPATPVNATNSQDSTPAPAAGRWADFVASVNQREPVVHAVKAKFKDGNKVEILTMQVDAITGPLVRGIIDSKPAVVRNVHAGDRVTVTQADIQEWTITRNGRVTTGSAR